jgi:hypothetical protein
MELNKVLATLVRGYQFSVANPMVRPKSVCRGLFVQSEMFVRVIKRGAGGYTT